MTTTVTTRTGVLQGVQLQSGVTAFLGVPYALPPLGERRWRAPMPLPDSNELLSCRRFGYSAMQVEDPIEPSSLNAQSEDCLTLNVWTKTPGRGKRPVMVYIHGGAYFSGGSSDPLYDGANFAAAQDVVIVTINYRINIFGSLALSALPGGQDYREAGYLGLLDQIAALRWVKENIWEFGGDPDCITIFGESAGSASAALLSICPAAKGLFHRAICESGSIQLYKTESKGIPYATEFAEIMNCSSVQDLLEKTSDELIAGMKTLCDRHPFEVSNIFCPICDGTLLPEKPLRAWAEGAAKDIDIMIGTVDDEMNYFKFYFTGEQMPLFWREQAVFQFDSEVDMPAIEQAFATLHPELDLSVADDYIKLMDEMAFHVGSYLMAELQATYRPTYVYRFAYKSTNEGMGSCHAIEVPFVMKNLTTPNGLEFTGPNPPAHLADEMNATWFSFARTGRPEARGLGEPSWPPYSGETKGLMFIDDKTWEMRESIDDKNIEFFKPLYEQTIM